MKSESVKLSKVKIWSVFIALFICGAFLGVGIANWGHSIKNKHVESVDMVQNEGGVGAAIRGFIEREKNKFDEYVQDEDVQKEQVEKTCQAVEKVLLNRLWDDDGNCEGVEEDFEIYKKLLTYGCPDNQERFLQMAKNKEAILDVACAHGVDVENRATCEKIEESLYARLPSVSVESDAERHIDRAKIYAVMAERGCPENADKYTSLAKQELDIARAVQDDKFDEDETIEVVETYKRLRMQRDAEEIFNKAKKLTNPAIDFIMQVEKIINE